MPTLLVIDSSPRQDAASRQLTERFVARWHAVFPATDVRRHDIGAEPPQHLDDELIDALRREPETLSDRQAAARAASDAAIADMQAADAIVIGAPMHNFTVTGALRTWIDHVARPGRTFGYDPETGPKGLLDDKPVFVLSTRGGIYGDGDLQSPHPADFQTPYLRHILGFMGLRDIRIVAANGMDMGPGPRAEGLAAAASRIDDAIAGLAQASAAAA